MVTFNVKTTLNFIMNALHVHEEKLERDNSIKCNKIKVGQFPVKIQEKLLSWAIVLREKNILFKEMQHRELEDALIFAMYLKLLIHYTQSLTIVFHSKELIPILSTPV